ncbi:MAG: damage-control phosphatase ARMT1 family protein [Anaerolineales bacterium]
MKSSRTFVAEQACLRCMQAQAERLAQRLAGSVEDPDQLRVELLSFVSPGALGISPPLIASAFHRRARELSGISDPYREDKRENTRMALELLPGLRRRLAEADDSLETAIQLAIAGNIIDFGPGKEFDLQTQINQALSVPLDAPTLNRFKQDLANANRILYLGDNTGEAVFDRILIEQFDKPVTYTVRGSPVINDVTEIDAHESGLDQVAAILSTGSDIPGIIPDECSPAFRHAFETADLIISKGQGNYESLSGTSRPVYFMLVIKCELVASHLNRQVGDCVMLAANP